MTENNLINEKALAFAERIYRLNCHLKDIREFSISDQILRSGTSIGANLAESLYAESNEDYIHKVSIALKEASETKFWLKLLVKTKLIEEDYYQSLYNEVDELLRMLFATIRTLKAKK